MAEYQKRISDIEQEIELRKKTTQDLNKKSEELTRFLGENDDAEKFAELRANLIYTRKYNQHTKEIEASIQQVEAEFKEKLERQEALDQKFWQAFEGEDKDGMTLALKEGADVYARNPEGKTALEMSQTVELKNFLAKIQDNHDARFEASLAPAKLLGGASAAASVSLDDISAAAEGAGAGASSLPIEARPHDESGAAAGGHSNSGAGLHDSSPESVLAGEAHAAGQP